MGGEADRDDAPDQGRGVAHRGARSGEGEAELRAELDQLDGELSLFEGSAVRPVRRGPGRPPGSPNRSTLQLKRLLLARGYRDPAEALAAIVTMGTRDLAGELRPDKRADGVTFDQAHEVLKLQVRAAEALMPFFHQKMPIAVEHRGDALRPVIVINEGGTWPGASRDRDAGMSVHEVLEVEPVQALSPKAASASDRTGNEGDSQGVDNAG